jgi:hypothetical protein
MQYIWAKRRFAMKEALRNVIPFTTKKLFARNLRPLAAHKILASQEQKRDSLCICTSE